MIFQWNSSKTPKNWYNYTSR